MAHSFSLQKKKSSGDKNYIIIHLEEEKVELSVFLCAGEMLGISYGELFLLLGATAALIGPKDLPVIARTVGRLAGRAIGYVQVARGQFESVMQQTQARQVHKELQDTIAQLEAIRHEIRTISFMNPGPMTRRLVDNVDQLSAGNVGNAPERNGKESTSATTTSSKDHSFTTSASFDVRSQATANEKLAESSTSKDRSFIRSASSDLYHQETASAESAVFKDENLRTSASSDLHSQATAYARLAESTSLNSESVNNDILSELTDESGHVIVLPVSAETAELLPKRNDDIKGSDIMLEAVLEAEVARNAKDFFTQPQNLKIE